MAATGRSTLLFGTFSGQELDSYEGTPVEETVGTSVSEGIIGSPS